MKQNAKSLGVQKNQNKNTKKLYDYVYKGDFAEICKLLKKKAVNVNTIPQGEKSTVLAVAASRGSSNIIQALLEHGADVNARGEKQWTPLMFAAAMGHAAVVNELLHRGADINLINTEDGDALYLAIVSNHVEVVKLLCAHGAIDVNVIRQKQWAPLMAAAAKGHTAVVELLLKKGADVQIRGVEQRTPLMVATLGEYADVVKMLLEKGAEVNARNEKQWTSLMAAASRGHVAIVKMLLQYGADIHSVNKEGETALHLAIFNNHPEVVKILREAGAAVNRIGKTQQPPLMKAVAAGNESIVKALLENGVDVNIRGEKRCTPLMLAAAAGHAVIVQMLLKHGADTNPANEEGVAALHLAIIHNHLEVIKILCEVGGADVDKIIVENKQYSGWTPLQLAVNQGNETIISYLLQRKPNLELKIGSEGFTVLHSAASGNNFKIVQMLLDKGANVTAMCKGNTPLHIAARYNRATAILYLVKRGRADVNAVTDADDTALHIAAQKGNIDAVKILLGLGANLALQNKEGKTAFDLAGIYQHQEIQRLLLEKEKELNLVRAGDIIDCMSLHLAAARGNVQMCEYLLNQGADVQSRDENDMTPLHFAAQEGHLGVVKILLNKGAQVNASRQGGMTPLHFAVQQGHLGVVRLLLEKKADVNSVMSLGGHWTPLHLAIQCGHVDIVKLLLEKGADANRLTSDGRTALHIAAQGENLTIIDMLLQKGENINYATQVTRMTAIHFAIENKKVKNAMFLLERSANLHLKNFFGYTPLDMAKKEPALFQDVITYPIKVKVDSIKNTLGKLSQSIQQNLNENGDVILLFSNKADATRFFEALRICYSGQCTLSQNSISLNVFTLETFLKDAASAQSFVIEMKRICREVLDVFRRYSSVDTYSVGSEHISYSGGDKETFQKLSKLDFFTTYSLRLNLDIPCIDIPKSIFLDTERLNLFKKDLELTLQALSSRRKLDGNGNKAFESEEIAEILKVQEEAKKAAEIASRKTPATRFAIEQRKEEALRAEKEAERLALEIAALARKEREDAHQKIGENKTTILARKQEETAPVVLRATDAKPVRSLNQGLSVEEEPFIPVKKESKNSAKRRARPKEQIKKEEKTKLQGLEVEGLKDACSAIRNLMQKVGETILDYKFCLLADLKPHHALQEKTCYLSENPRQCQFRDENGEIHTLVLPAELDLNNLGSRLEDPTLKWQLAEFMLAAGWQMGFWDVAMQRHILHGLIYIIDMLKTVNRMQTFQQLVAIRNQLAHECCSFDEQGEPQQLVLYSKEQLIAMGEAIMKFKAFADKEGLLKEVQNLLGVFKENQGVIIEEKLPEAHSRRMAIHLWRLRQNKKRASILEEQVLIGNEAPDPSIVPLNSSIVMLYCKIGEAHSRLSRLRGSSFPLQHCQRVRNQEYHQNNSGQSSQGIEKYVANQFEDVSTGVDTLLESTSFSSLTRLERVEVWGENKSSFFRASPPLFSSCAEPSMKVTPSGPPNRL